MALDTVTERLQQARRGVAPGGRGGSGDGPAPATGTRRSPLGRAGLTLALFALPSLVLLVLLNVFPVVYAFVQSLQDGTPSTLPWETPFVGLQNYAAVITSEQFLTSARFTVIFTLSGVFGSWAVGLLLSLLLRTRIPGNAAFKVLLLLPWIVPVVVSATSWNWLVATPQSPVPIILGAVGIPDANFLGDPVLAQVVVCVFKIWISFPFMMMMMSAALASVDTNVYEAAKMDGATHWQAFTGVTLPIIARTTYISWVLMTIFCVNDFPTIFLLTQGGPSTGVTGATTSLIVLAYQYAFQNLQTGPATAVAFMMTTVLVIISTVLYQQIKKANVE